MYNIKLPFESKKTRTNNNIILNRIYFYFLILFYTGIQFWVLHNNNQNFSIFMTKLCYNILLSHCTYTKFDQRTNFF